MTLLAFASYMTWGYLSCTAWLSSPKDRTLAFTGLFFAVFSLSIFLG